MNILLVVRVVNDDAKQVRDCVELWLGAQSGDNEIRYAILAEPGMKNILELEPLIDTDGELRFTDQTDEGVSRVVVDSDNHSPIHFWDAPSSPETREYSVFCPQAPLLSILIPHIRCRGEMLRRLISKLRRQAEAFPHVEILVENADGVTPIGTIRQRLIERASGQYVAFVDDDDDVSDEYLASVMPVLDTWVDAVGFHIRAVWHRKEYGVWRCSNEYSTWNEGTRANPIAPIVGGERTPYHITPMRRAIAIAAGFPPDMSYGEDAVFAERLKALGLIRVMPVVERVLYEYRLPMIRGRTSVHEQWQSLEER